MSWFMIFWVVVLLWILLSAYGCFVLGGRADDRAELDHYLRITQQEAQRHGCADRVDPDAAVTTEPSTKGHA